MSGANKPKSYSSEFKEQAAKMVLDSSRPIRQIARELGVNDNSLGLWVKAYRRQRSGEAPPPDLPDEERLRQLERRNRELEMENAFLKKAAAYFAREHR